MSDLEPNRPGTISPSPDAPGVEPRVLSDPSALKIEREGLPRSYRMRADSHYVDQFASRSSGQPVRMLAIEEVDALAPDDKTDLSLLVQSIRAHGVLHPLLVRRRGSRYAVIAGRSRLAAARQADLPSVPCLVHEADDPEADALARADNVSGRGASVGDDVDLVAAVREAVAHHLSTVHGAADMIGTATGAIQAASIDLMKAHAWRAARLNDILNVLTHVPARPCRRRSLSSVVVQVMDGFAPECRMTGVTLGCQITEATSSVQVSDDDLFVGLVGAVCATLPLVEKLSQPTLSVKLTVTPAGAVSLDTVLGPGAVASTLVARFFDLTSSDRPGGWSAAAGAAAARAVATCHGGSATFGVNADGTGVLQMRFPPR